MYAWKNWLFSDSIYKWISHTSKVVDSQYWFRYCLGVKQASGHYRIQWWLILMTCICIIRHQWVTCWACIYDVICMIICPHHTMPKLFCLTWWGHQMEAFSTLLAICAGNSPVTGEFPVQRPVTQSFDVFFDMHQNKQLGKQWWGWGFETPSWPLLRHCNAKCVTSSTLFVTCKPSCWLVVIHMEVCMVMWELYCTNGTLRNKKSYVTTLVPEVGF